MRIELLGPLSASHNETSIVPSAAKPCQILALLALNPDRLVTKSDLFEELWENNPPQSATTTIHTYIHQLRRLIDKAVDGRHPTGSREILVTHRSGYSLSHAVTDAQEFRRLSAEGTRASEDGDRRMASRLLGAALDLWRGPVLSDVQIGPLLGLEAMALQDAREAALSRRIDADLHLGRHHEIVGELRTLSSRHPINERFAAHYMVSLYESGRINGALQEFQRIRTLLIDELGVEPAPRLRRLQEVILSGGRPLLDPVLTAMA
ncbi:BTAD domain-containing putative transcriptional regulator [Micromonospora sp. NBC_01638]|uniref:AfsR/SARP family transcriptional regulator n=1 Tax=Micromonospora sp. NBC_01638 TaxID=2975982 RepID=UPI00386857AC|nr:AfsR/SARP family transcriptional regulator [Micromonospora sp. NBC_01638]